MQWAKDWCHALRHGTYGVGYWEGSARYFSWPHRIWYDGYWYAARIGPFYFHYPN